MWEKGPLYVGLRRITARIYAGKFESYTIFFLNYFSASALGNSDK